MGADSLPWISPTYNNPYPFRADSSVVILQIPVRLEKGINSKTVHLSLESVIFNQRLEKRLKEAFMLIDTLINNGTAIEIRINLNLAYYQGTYRLTVQAQEVHEESLSFSLEIVHPKAELADPSKIIINKVEDVGTNKILSSSSLALRETAGNSWITHIQQTTFRVAGANNSLFNGTVVLDHLSPIAPNFSLTPSYSVKGTFPLGPTQGEIILTAPQLEGSKVLPIEIHTRRTYFWLFFSIALGLVVGYFIRHFLEDYISLRETRLQGYNLLERIQQSLARYGQNQKFKEKSESWLSDLQALLKTSDRNKIATEITASEEQLQQAINDTEAEQQKLQAEIEEWVSLLKYPFQLPPAIQQLVEKSFQQIVVIRYLIVNYQLEKGQEELASLRDNLTASLQKTIPEWKNSIQQLNELAKIARFLPAEVETQLLQGLEKSRALFGEINENPVTSPTQATPATLFEILNKIRLTRITLGNIYAQLQTWLESSYRDFMSVMTLIESKLPDVQALQNLGKSVTTLLVVLRTQSENPDQALSVFDLNTYENVHSAWENSINNQLKKANKTIEELVDNRRYFDAAITLKETTEAKDPTRPETSAMKSVNSKPLPPFLPEKTQAVFPSIPPPRISAPLSSPKERTAQELSLARWTRFLIVGVGILLVGYLLYADEYIGHFKELASIFMWAFGLDISANVLLQEITRVRST